MRRFTYLILEQDSSGHRLSRITDRFLATVILLSLMQIFKLMNYSTANDEQVTAT